MRSRGPWRAWLALALAACGAGNAAGVVDPPIVDRPVATTSGAIAVANLDHEIARHRDEAEVEELLLARARFLGDYEALDRATALAEGRFGTAGELLQRARARSAEHRFADALADVAAAESAGAPPEEVGALRAAIFVATGRAAEVVAQLEAGVARRPGFASYSALAGAYAAVGRFGDADGMYVAALADLDTTSPFPYAWVYFARGSMWAEQGGDPARGRAMYAQALVHLPEFATANVHLAELEVGLGDLASAMARLDRVVAASDEPEALALLGEVHARTGDPVRGRVEIARARERYDSLLARHPLAFADHAAEFYLGPGADAERAWSLARQNLGGRQTERAFALAIEAARASGRHREASSLAVRMGRATAGRGRTSRGVPPKSP